MNYQVMTGVLMLLAMACIVAACFMLHGVLGVFALGVFFLLLALGAYETHKEEKEDR